MLTRTKGIEKELTVIGTRPVRPDGVPKVIGSARYGAEYSAPGERVVGAISSWLSDC